jgi:hypothetical protein
MIALVQPTAAAQTANLYRGPHPEVLVFMCSCVLVCLCLCDAHATLFLNISRRLCRLEWECGYKMIRRIKLFLSSQVRPQSESKRAREREREEERSEGVEGVEVSE